MYRIVIAGMMLLALLTAVQPTCVYACSCMVPGPPDQALAESGAVFSGTVTAVARPANMGGSMPVRVTFSVARVWKGPEQVTMIINTPDSSASCGFDFVENGEYLVYARNVEGTLEASLCSRTTQLANAGEDIAALGEGTAPAAPAGGAETPSVLPATGEAQAPYLVPAAFGMTFAVLVAGAVVVIRRRQMA